MSASSYAGVDGTKTVHAVSAGKALELVAVNESVNMRNGLAQGHHRLARVEFSVEQYR